jgi:hypothetical protein
LNHFPTDRTRIRQPLQNMQIKFWLLIRYDRIRAMMIHRIIDGQS